MRVDGFFSAAQYLLETGISSHQFYQPVLRLLSSSLKKPSILKTLYQFCRDISKTEEQSFAPAFDREIFKKIDRAGSVSKEESEEAALSWLLLLFQWGKERESCAIMTTRFLEQLKRAVFNSYDDESLIKEFRGLLRCHIKDIGSRTQATSRFKEITSRLKMVPELYVKAKNSSRFSLKPCLGQLSGSAEQKEDLFTRLSLATGSDFQWVIAILAIKDELCLKSCHREMPQTWKKSSWNITEVCASLKADRSIVTHCDDSRDGRFTLKKPETLNHSEHRNSLLKKMKHWVKKYTIKTCHYTAFLILALKEVTELDNSQLTNIFLRVHDGIYPEIYEESINQPMYKGEKEREFEAGNYIFTEKVLLNKLNEIAAEVVTILGKSLSRIQKSQLEYFLEVPAPEGWGKNRSPAAISRARKNCAEKLEIAVNLAINNHSCDFADEAEYKIRLEVTRFSLDLLREQSAQKSESA